MYLAHLIGTKGIVWYMLFHLDCLVFMENLQLCFMEIFKLLRIFSKICENFQSFEEL